MQESILLGSAKELPESDADYGYVSSIASRAVEDVLQEENNSSPKPVAKTSSFYVVVGTSLAGMVALYLTNKGAISSTQTGMATDILSAAITFGIAWVVGKFVEARGNVSVAKVHLAEQQVALRAALENKQNG